ncbi:MAG: hypothetical protein AAFO07_31945, partial [Bacteroidota bacterium]
MKHYLSILLVIFSTFHLHSRHILGGYMTYECLGDGDFKFMLHVYRDCACTDCADFDGIADIGIYNCNWEECSDLNQSSFMFRLQVPLKEVKTIDTNVEGICQNINGICIEEGIYEFRLSDYGALLPPIEDDYFIVYQRLCRYVLDNNIEDSENRGKTLFSRIT